MKIDSANPVMSSVSKQNIVDKQEIKHQASLKKNNDKEYFEGQKEATNFNEENNESLNLKI
jgi:predicted transcriptional regulator